MKRFEGLVIYADRVIGYTSGLTESQFRRDEAKVAAVERCLSIIGDLVDTLDKEEREGCHDFNLAPFSGLGDHLIHEYDLVDVHRIWSLARDSAPKLKASVEQTLRSHFSDSVRF